MVSLLSSKSGPPGTPGQTPEQRAQPAQRERNAAASPRVLPQAPLQTAKLDLAERAFGLPCEAGPGRLDAARQPRFRPRRGRRRRCTPPAQLRGRTRADLGQYLVNASGERNLAGACRRSVRAGRRFRASYGRAGYQGNGALNGSLRMDGTGRSIAEILATADGAASLWMLEGDLSSLLVDLAGLRLGSALLSSLNGSPTTHCRMFRRGYCAAARRLVHPHADCWRPRTL